MIDSIVKNTDSDDIDELVMRARIDSNALSILYDMYYARILLYCQRRLNCMHAAQDITSEVFLIVATKIRGFTGNTETVFCSWIYTIATNQCNLYLRNNIRRKELMSIIKKEAVCQANADLSSDVNWQGLYNAISKLKHDYQSIIMLRFFEKMTHKQISEILKANPVTIRVKQLRALSKLKKFLGKDFTCGGD